MVINSGNDGDDAVLIMTGHHSCQPVDNTLLVYSNHTHINRRFDHHRGCLLRSYCDSRIRWWVSALGILDSDAMWPLQRAEIRRSLKGAKVELG